MIFSNFLKKKWQHKNSTVRVEAINNSLSIVEPAQREIIEVLAKTDENENVRRASLIKLDNFQSWLTHSQENTMAKVKQYAGKKVAAILTEQDAIKLSEQEKLDYIAAHNHYDLYESWLKSAEDANLIIALFEKLAIKSKANDQNNKTALKPQLLLNLFNQKQNLTVQQYIVTKVDDVETLEKLKKKSHQAEITEQLTEKISQLQFTLEQPIVLRKKVNLVLAKLQALKDQYEYQIYLEKRALLNNEWQSLRTEFTCFEAAEITTFFDKKTAIITQLDKLFVAKAEQHAQAEIASALDKNKQQARVHFDKTLAIIDQTLTTSIFENDEIEEQQYQTLFDKLTSEIISSALTKDEQNEFIAKICQQQQKLQQLPEIAQSVSDATHLISKVSQLAMPTTVLEMNERQPTFNEWLANWKSAEINASGNLPDSIKNAANEIQRNWRQAIKPLQQAQKQEFSVTQKKLHDVKRLIAAGKYNAAFGVFKKAKQLFNSLSEQQQYRLQKDYDSLNEKIAELADWEHYIATPRKQQLLADIKAIVETPLDNPNEQAEKVKQYRKTWNSLGHADDDAEQSLNTEFNTLCETAFTPCRLYFAEQEKIRAQHLITRQSFVEQAKMLAEQLTSAKENDNDSSEVDFKTLEAELNQLIKQWQSAGQVDRGVYQDINEQFNLVLQPIKSAIKTFHHENKLLKQELIISAEKLLADEDIFAAVTQVKELQTQWRKTGHAGAKIENKLWQSFRKINDNIFAKREQKSVLEKSATIAKVAELESTLTRLEDEFSQVTQLIDLQKYEQALQALHSDVAQQKPKMVNLEKQINAKEKALAKKIVDFNITNEKRQWGYLFSTLEESITNEKSFAEQKDYLHLSAFWQKKLKDLANNKTHFNREDATLELEILSGIPSPSELQQRRMTVQVILMQAQMSSGAEIDLPAKFTQWLMLGCFTQQDVELLQRIKAVFQ
ncbi:MAG: exonuclease SbcC [Cognaticolwellia sp.]|jgi:exonuclease SbcC